MRTIIQKVLEDNTDGELKIVPIKQCITGFKEHTDGIERMTKGDLHGRRFRYYIFELMSDKFFFLQYHPYPDCNGIIIGYCKLDGLLLEEFEIFYEYSGFGYGMKFITKLINDNKGIYPDGICSENFTFYWKASDNGRKIVDKICEIMNMSNVEFSNEVRIGMLDKYLENLYQHTTYILEIYHKIANYILDGVLKRDDICKLIEESDDFKRMYSLRRRY